MRRYIFIASALLVSAALSAQNLNPTVQVTNDYEGKLMEVGKQTVQMAVPDSLLKFDWNFNYSVFDNPYRGAYEFSPYRIDMKPDAAVRESGKFYLRAGAGYRLHPEAKVVFTPETKGSFGISFYDDFKGYSGKYHDISAVSDPSGIYLIAPDGDFKGCDLSNRLGTELRYDAKRSVITLDGGFDWIRADRFSGSGNDPLSTVYGNQVLGGSALLRARSLVNEGFIYDISGGWTGLSNKPDRYDGSDSKYKEHDLGFDGFIGIGVARRHSVLIEPSWHHTIFSDILGQQALADAVSITPAYVFSDEGFSVRVGVRYSNVWRDVKNTSSLPASYKGRTLYPDFRLSYEAVPDKLVLSAKVTGGQHFNTYGSYLKSNHLLPELSSEAYFGSIGDATVNTFDAGVGISGRVKSRFQYAASAGYARYFNAPLDGAAFFYYPGTGSSGSDSPSTVMSACVPVIAMMNYDLIYADLSGAVNSDRVDASFQARVQKSDLKPEMEKGYFAVTLPLFKGSAEVVYNWNRRMFLGVVTEWSTSRDGEGLYYSPGTVLDCHIPGWVDLGVTAELKLNRRFSVWAEGRNLLNQTVMRNFMYAEKGPYGTAGICLNF